MRFVRSLMFAFGFVLAFSATAQESDVPDLINYQGMVSDQSGQPLATGEYPMTFRIFTLPTAGTEVWGPQVFTASFPVFVVNGYFNVILGPADSFGRRLTDAFYDDVRYLEISVDGNTILPRQRILTTPYAITSHQVRGERAQLIKGRLQLSGSDENTDAILTNSLTLYLGTEVDVRLNGSSNFLDGQLTIGDSKHFFGTAGDSGYYGIDGANGNGNIAFTSLSGSENHGYISIQDSSGNRRLSEFIGSGGDGQIWAYGPNGNVNFGLSSFSSNRNYPYMSLRDAGGSTRVQTYVDTDSAGFLFTSGSNGNLNTGLSALAGNTNHGYVAVMNAAGDTKAAIYVDSTGKGRTFSDVKHFVVDHPSKSGSKIVYVSLEGPEAAMYFRGKARLERGRARVEFPEHFRVMAVEDSLTVNLTPHSLDSAGVAVAAVNGSGMSIGELQNGTGSYEVSFVVFAVRKGLQDHKPVMTIAEFQSEFTPLGSADTASVDAEVDHAAEAAEVVEVSDD